MATAASADAKSAGTPGWARDLSSRSIKKRLKLRHLERAIPDLGSASCLEHGAETGVVCDHLKRVRGGTWDAACLKPDWAPVAGALLGSGVIAIEAESPLPFDDAAYDLVLVSRPEHVLDDAQLFREARRILRPGGRLVVTTPHDDRGMFLNRVKERVGLTLEAYDHHRSGYSRPAMAQRLEEAGLRDIRVGSYCRFFSESIELAVNALYMKLRRREDGGGEAGRNEYRPRTGDEVKATGAAYRVYCLVFPILRLLSKADVLIPFTRGYVLLATAGK